ncbi:MAG: ABC transporter permease [Candidatus Izimaplasma sp.]|nr:ABC transporter permease [Candidatus Izimaplasma bacterium]
MTILSETLDTLYFIVPLIIASTIPLMLVATGALYSEGSGVVNIALEGIMLMGAFVGAVVMKQFEPTGTSTQMIALIGLSIGAITGIVFSFFHAFASINMKANQIISATALNMFAPAFAIFVNRTFSEQGTQRVLLQRNYRIPSVPLLGDIPIIGDLFFKGAYLSTLIGIILFIIVTIILYKTKWGLRLRSCGENPHAADSLGINVYKVRYAGVLVSGALAGMGGVIFVLSFATSFNANVAGFGFLALAVLIFGNWQPKRIFFAALFFAFMRIIANTSAAIPILNQLKLDDTIYRMVPYLATLVVLAIVSKNSAAPRAAGEPYDPGKR